MNKSDIYNMSDSGVNKTVKIQGTKWDRKRRVSMKTVAEINRLQMCGCSNSKIAKKLNLNYSTVRYYTDDEYKNKVNHRKGAHSHGYLSDSNRAEYKRKLVMSGAHVIYPID